MKTKYSSYCENGIAKGCKFCVQGAKLVLFISGKCSRNCWYCSLSKKRKNIDKIWANEREINSVEDMLEEIKESRATSAGITGGDPLLCLNKTIKYVKTLKKSFGKKFHIHIYLPTKLVNINNLRQLSKYVDEVRFHPSFLVNGNDKDIDKIKLANNYWSKNNIGIELPLIPEKKKEILNFILKLKNYIGFVNLNEFELSDTNFSQVTRKYKLNEGGYTIKGSIEAGLWILNKLKSTNLRIHLCTADLKNNYQFKNRLKRHEILPFGKKTGEGTVIYFVVEADKNKLNSLNKKLKGFIDSRKSRIIINPSRVRQLLKSKQYRIFRVEEYPTYDAYEVEKNEV